MNPEDIYQNLDDDDRRLLDELLENPSTGSIAWKRVLALLCKKLPEASRGTIVVRDDGANLRMAFRGVTTNILLVGYQADGQFVSRFNIESLQEFFFVAGFN